MVLKLKIAKKLSRIGKADVGRHLLNAFATRHVQTRNKLYKEAVAALIGRTGDVVEGVTAEYKSKLRERPSADKYRFGIELEVVVDQAVLKNRARIARHFDATHDPSISGGYGDWTDVAKTNNNADPTDPIWAHLASGRDRRKREEIMRASLTMPGRIFDQRVAENGDPGLALDVLEDETRGTAVEYVYRGVFDLADLDRPKVKDSFNGISESWIGCLYRSCGTHVHMSHLDASWYKHPLLPAALKRVWLHYQGYMNDTFYPDRRDAEYAADNAPGPAAWREQKLNFEPTWLASPKEGVHVEFRGLGEIITKRGPFPFDFLKSYLHILVSIWETALKLAAVEERNLSYEILKARSGTMHDLSEDIYKKWLKTHGEHLGSNRSARYLGWQRIRRRREAEERVREKEREMKENEAVKAAQQVAQQQLAREAYQQHMDTFGGRTNLGKIGTMCVLQRALSDGAAPLDRGVRR